MLHTLASIGTAHADMLYLVTWVQTCQTTPNATVSQAMH